MPPDTVSPILSPNEAACVTGIPLRQVHRIIDAGLLERATSGGKRARAIRHEGLVGLKLAHELSWLQSLPRLIRDGGVRAANRSGVRVTRPGRARLPLMTRFPCGEVSIGAS